MLIHPGRALEQCGGDWKREQLLRQPGQPCVRPHWPGQSASQGHLQSTAEQSSTCQDQLYKKIRAKKLHVSRSTLVDERRASYLSLERRGLLGEALEKKFSGPSRSHSCRDFPAKVYTWRMRRRET